MFVSQTRDLYHIETDREGGYIEFAERQIYRVEHSETYRRKNKSAPSGADLFLISDSIDFIRGIFHFIAVHILEIVIKYFLRF